jgi:hypothetical protein
MFNESGIYFLLENVEGAKERLIEEMEGEKCQGYFCSRIITAEDIAEIKKLQSIYPLKDYELINNDYFAPRCEECYQEWFLGKDLEAYYNAMHPEETVEKFLDHEDMEPKD